MKVYLVCHRDDYRDVVAVSLRRFSFLSLSLSLSLYERDAFFNEFFRSSVIATMFNFSVSLFCPFWNFLIKLVIEIVRNYLFERRGGGKGVILSCIYYIVSQYMDFVGFLINESRGKLILQKRITFFVFNFVFN